MGHSLFLGITETNRKRVCGFPILKGLMGRGGCLSASPLPHGACVLQPVRKSADIRDRRCALRPWPARLAPRSLLCDSGHVEA